MLDNGRVAKDMAPNGVARIIIKRIGGRVRKSVIKWYEVGMRRIDSARSDTKNDSGLVILVTGASSGIGRCVATRLSDKGHRVYGTSRHKSNNTSYKYQMIEMDVDLDDSVSRGIEHILSRERRLDVVVNNAGYGLAGSIEDTTLSEAKAQFETNFFGVMRVCRAALPAMRAQQSGYIVNISSMAGRFSLAFQGLYSASKFAVEGFSEALCAEVRRLGIHVVLVEPGDFKTGFTSSRVRAEGANQNSPYYEKYAKLLTKMESCELRGPTPERVAYVIEQIISDPSPRMRYLTGLFNQKFTAVVKHLMSHRVFEWLVLRYYGYFKR